MDKKDLLARLKEGPDFGWLLAEAGNDPKLLPMLFEIVRSERSAVLICRTTRKPCFVLPMPS